MFATVGQAATNHLALAELRSAGRLRHLHSLPEPDPKLVKTYGKICALGRELLDCGWLGGTQGTLRPRALLQLLQTALDASGAGSAHELVFCDVGFGSGAVLLCAEFLFGFGHAFGLELGPVPTCGGDLEAARGVLLDKTRALRTLSASVCQKTGVCRPSTSPLPPVEQVYLYGRTLTPCRTPQGTWVPAFSDAELRAQLLGRKALVFCFFEGWAFADLRALCAWLTANRPSIAAAVMATSHNDLATCRLKPWIPLLLPVFQNVRLVTGLQMSGSGSSKRAFVFS